MDNNNKNNPISTKNPYDNNKGGQFSNPSKNEMSGEARANGIKNPMSLNQNNFNKYLKQMKLEQKDLDKEDQSPMYKAKSAAIEAGKKGGYDDYSDFDEKGELMARPARTTSLLGDTSKFHPDAQVRGIKKFNDGHFEYQLKNPEDKDFRDFRYDDKNGHWSKDLWEFNQKDSDNGGSKIKHYPFTPLEDKAIDIIMEEDDKDYEPYLRNQISDEEHEKKVKDRLASELGIDEKQVNDLWFQYGGFLGGGLGPMEEEEKQRALKELLNNNGSSKRPLLLEDDDYNEQTPDADKHYGFTDEKEGTFITDPTYSSNGKDKLTYDQSTKRYGQDKVDNWLKETGLDKNKIFGSNNNNDNRPRPNLDFLNKLNPKDAQILKDSINRTFDSYKNDPDIDFTMLNDEWGEELMYDLTSNGFSEEEANDLVDKFSSVAPTWDETVGKKYGKTLKQMGLDQNDIEEPKQTSWSGKHNPTPEQENQLNKLVNSVFPGRDWKYIADHTDSPKDIYSGIKNFLETGNSEYLLNVLKYVKQRYDQYGIRI